MDFSFSLLTNAIVAGLLLGGFYAAVTAGISISFGMLDIVNIAHPAFIIVGSYIAYIVNINLGIDPIVVSVVMLPVFYALGAMVYQVYYLSFEKRGQESLRGLAFFFGLLFVTEVLLLLVFGVDYRSVNAVYIGPSLRLGPIELPLRLLVPCLASLAMFAALDLFLGRSFIGRAVMAVSQDPLALRLMAVDPIRIKRIAFGISIATASMAGAFLIVIQPVIPSVGRDYIGRIFAICVLGRARQPARHLDRGAAARGDREPDRDLLRAVLGAGGIVRHSAAHLGGAAFRIAGALGRAHTRLYPVRSRRRRGAVSLVPALRQRLCVFCRLHGAAIHRAGDGLEHPGRLLRLCELRLAPGFSRSAPIQACSSTRLGRTSTIWCPHSWPARCRRSFRCRCPSSSSSAAPWPDWSGSAPAI